MKTYLKSAQSHLQNQEEAEVRDFKLQLQFVTEAFIYFHTMAALS